MLMPQMGESITEATVSKWIKNVGDSVEKDEMILEITTDKVDSEIPAPDSGVIVSINAQEGETVDVKTVIAVIDTEASASSSAPQVEEKEDLAEAEIVEDSSNVNTDNLTTAFASSTDRFYSPLVRSLANKHGISLNKLDSIPGSGKGGRFTKDDFLAYIETGSSNTPKEEKTVAPEAKKAEATPVKTETSPAVKETPLNEWLPNRTKIVPMDNMRKAIAEHMVRSKHTSPHVYSVQEADVTNVAKWRKAYKDEFKKKEGFNLSFTPFFLEAAIKALQEFPIVNSSVNNNTVVYKKDVNLGCAVSIGNTGLIVPVIKQADEKNLVGIARSLNDLATRARDKKLVPDEVMNGTFTVTNPGVFGTLIGTPIISQPQSGILCLGAIEKRAVVIDDMIAIRDRCYLTLSYDHRIIDGAIGAQFLAYICRYLENWDMDRGLF